MNHLNPSTLPEPRGYTHVVAVERGRTIYVSGQIAVDRTGALVGVGDFGAQVRQVFENLSAALAASSATFDHVVKITVFVTDMAHIQLFRDVRSRYITGPPPASTLVQVAALARPELMIEIEAVAVVEASSTSSSLE